MNLKVMFTGLAAQQGQVEVELRTLSATILKVVILLESNNSSVKRFQCILDIRSTLLAQFQSLVKNLAR